MEQISRKMFLDKSLRVDKNKIIEDLEMFNLPNKPELTSEEFLKRAEELSKQYNIAVQNDTIRIEIKSKINDLLTANSGHHYDKVKEILDKAPQEAAPELARKLGYLPKGIQVKIARLLLDEAPQEAAPELARNFRYLATKGIQVEIVRLLLDKAPQEAAPELAENFIHLPKETRVKIVLSLLDKAPQEAAPGLAIHFPYFPEPALSKWPEFFPASLKVIRTKIVRLLLDKAPQEAAYGLSWNLGSLPKGIREEIVFSLLDKAPQEAANGLAHNFRY